MIDPQHPDAKPAPWSTGLGLLLPLGAVVALLLVIVLALGAAVRWLLFSPAGAVWALEHAPYVQATGFKGALLGDHWQIEKLHIQKPGSPVSYALEGLDAQGLRWVWRPHESAWLGLDVQQLSLRKLTLDTGPPGPRPLPLPQSLALPLHLKLAQGQVQTLQIDALAPITELQVQALELNPQPGAQHSVQQASAQWRGVQVQAQARIGTAAPLTLVGQATLRPVLGGDAPAWAAVLRASGDVPKLLLDGTLRGVPLPGRGAPALDLHVQLQPLQGWPLAGLKLQTQALDLSALLAGAPQTSLSGQALLTSSAFKAPMTASVELTNALPGRWNEGRLPVRRLTAELRGQLDHPDRLELRQFELSLADASQSAGSWTGSATWQGHLLSLQSQLKAVTPQRLDGRAAAMQISGPLAVTLKGMPSLAPSPAASSPAPAHRAEWTADLQGSMEAAPQTVRLEMQGSLDEQGLDLQRAKLTSGKALADLQAHLQRSGAREWKLQTSGSLVEFDPQPWWPGEAGTAWRRGPHRLTADWQFDALLPARPDKLPLVALAQRVAGNGRLRVHDSVLAGVPVSADLTLAYAQAASPAPASLRGELQLGGNLVRLDGSGDPAGAGTADRLQAEIKAEQLAALAPLARLHPALETWLPLRGSAIGSISLAGRWPSLRTEGKLQLDSLQAGPLALKRADATWRMDMADAQTLALQADASVVQWGRQRFDALRADLRGTLADHRIEISATLPVAPPAELVRVLGVAEQSGTRASLQASGAWRAEPAGGGRWQAQVERLEVATWDTKGSTTQTAGTWVAARDLRGQLAFNAEGDLLSLQADAGRLMLAQNVALRWDDVRVQFGAGRPQIQLHASVEPFALAPLLARLQPGLGWQGDLRLGGRLDIRASDRMDADVVFERIDGDLHLGGAEGVQLLGLTEARLSLSAHDGVWLFTPQFKGRILGEISGSARVKTTPEQRWPEANAPLEGSVQAHVANLGIWGAWVPPGWRLGGDLRTTATLGGKFGEPRYTGEITGNGLSVRNLLAGVNISDGQIDVRLEGDSARVERFTLRGGEGSVSVTGGATLGASPQVNLRVSAQRFRVLARVDRSITASGDADFTFTPAAGGKLEGAIKLDEGFFDAATSDAPSLDDDVTVRMPGAPEEPAIDPTAPRTQRKFVLGMDLDLGDHLRVRGRGVDTGLRGKLRLSDTGGRLSVQGTVTAVDGTYAAYGQKLSIERGIVAFSGPLDNPRLDVLALRPHIDQRVGVLITGNLQTLRVRLYSDPELAHSEKLSWLVLGRAPDGLGRNDTALIQRAALALLAGEGEAPTDALMRSLGIDEISLRQGDTDVRQTVISLGKQLSRRWYVGYERGVNSTTGTWQLIYRIAQRFTLRAQSGLDNSLDMIWIWRFQEAPPDAAVRKSTLIPP